MADKNVELVITELKLDGEGNFDDQNAQSFTFTGASHTASDNDWEMELKVNSKRVEYPGGNTVVEHLMAATWQPFQISGEWNDMWANKREDGSNTFARDAYTYRTFLDFSRLVTRMPLVRITLDNNSLVGVITNFRPRYRMKEQIAWSFTFSPHVNEGVDLYGFDQNAALITKSIPQWLQESGEKAQELQDELDAAKYLALKTESVDRFTAAMLEINDAITRLTDQVQNGFTSDTEHKLILLSTTFRRVRSASYNLVLAFQQRRADLDIAYDDALLASRHTEWIMNAVTMAFQMAGIANDAEIDMRSRSGKNAVAIYYPMKGESLERISTRFYGTPNEWRTIYWANNLDSLVLDGTEELIIPKRPS